jgi:integrase
MDTIIRSLEPGSKRQIYWCNGCPGFGLRITPSGCKSFIFKYMSSRESRWVTLGKYPQLSIHEARRQYYDLYEQVNDYGRDPVQEEKDELERQKLRPTVSAFIETYLDLMRLKEKASIKEEERVFGTDVKPVIGDILIDEVTSKDVDDIQMRIMQRAKTRHNATRGGKVAVKNTLAYTRQLFNLAKKKGILKSNPVTEIESLGVSGTRERVLSFNEIWKFWNGLEDAGVPPVTANALKFSLVTMQRSNEVRRMRYAAIKPDEGVWHMEKHETKNRTMHRVPLNCYALEIIEKVKPFTDASPYVFGATRAFSAPENKSPDLVPLGSSALSQAIRRNRDLLEIDDICPHDLRRTGATWITAVGLPKLYARLMLNNSDGERDVTGEVYVQYSYDFEKRRAAQVWEFVLDQIITCSSAKDIPTLEVLREQVVRSGLI